MKLKYYLRGLAVGVLLATIILSIANAGNRPLTDAQIRKRALELGMIEGDSVKLSSLQAVEGTDKSGEASESTVKDTTLEGSTADNTREQDVESSSENSVSANRPSESGDSADSSLSASRPLVSESTEGSSASVSRPSASEESQTSSTSASVVPESSSEGTVQTISFQIRSGASSYTVSKELASLGLVEDAAAFDDFLCNNGYSRKLHAGTYNILPGTSEEDIAKLITR